MSITITIHFLRVYVLYPFLFSNTDINNNEPDYIRKDAFLIGTTLYIYGKPYNRTMYDKEYGSASAEVINVTAVCTLTHAKVETKNIKIPDIFYFLDASTIKVTTTQKCIDDFYNIIKSLGSI